MMAEGDQYPDVRRITAMVTEGLSIAWNRSNVKTVHFDIKDGSASNMERIIVMDRTTFIS